MTTSELTPSDIEQINNLNLDLDTVHDQIKRFENGFPFLEIVDAATVDNSIIKISSQDEKRYIAEWERYLRSEKSVVKFVPASGAASRMFKSLYHYLDSDNIEVSGDVKLFFENIQKFAFYTDLDQTCMHHYNKNVIQLIEDSKHKLILKQLLSQDGLSYGQLPKALLKFHKYRDYARTPIEEHLVEGATYAKNSKQVVNIHFTISVEHHQQFISLVDAIKHKYENELHVHYNITFSYQRTSTNTIAVDKNNRPFRENGQIVFRPAGHGALLENLNDIQADIIFLKNIDNVVPDRHRLDDVKFKKILAGCLVATQSKIFTYLHILDSGNYNSQTLNEMLNFLENQLHVLNPAIKTFNESQLATYLKNKLNRPIRVCGMVPNTGEPGGGPFYTVCEDKTISLQILEGAQIDLSNPHNQRYAEKGTHFNPVDIVCAVKNYKGLNFDLRNFVDINTGFITYKTKNGKDLKALELPGLWNGAMSDWNTLFIEVPLSTFNPVKTINDLLRDCHQ